MFRAAVPVPRIPAATLFLFTVEELSGLDQPQPTTAFPEII